MANQAMNFLSTGRAPQRLGNAHPNIVPYQVFACADGHFIVASGNDGQFPKLCALLGAPDIATQADYATNADRLNNRDALTKTLSDLMADRTKADLLTACELHGVPAGPINDMAEVFADPQIVARGMQVDLDGVPSVRLPVLFSGSEAALQTPAPTLGGNQDLLD
jgi:crotonobetainyl-CoA:carnitine CoA-transferase CaiB-like acyl-CoA transferase